MAQADDKNAGNPAEIPRYDNIRNLIYHLNHLLDQRILQHREGTTYGHVRQSDAQVFVQATRRKMSMSEIARELKITRQAVQSSVKRLRELGVVDLEAIPGNRRDKWLVITQQGLVGQAEAVEKLALLEKDVAASLGEIDLETFRRSLAQVLEGLTKITAAHDGLADKPLTQPE